MLLFCHNSRVWRTDGQTGGQTDGWTALRSSIPRWIQCSAVKTQYDGLNDTAYCTVRGVVSWIHNSSTHIDVNVCWNRFDRFLSPFPFSSNSRAAIPIPMRLHGKIRTWNSHDWYCPITRTCSDYVIQPWRQLTSLMKAIAHCTSVISRDEISLSESRSQNGL